MNSRASCGSNIGCGSELRRLANSVLLPLLRAGNLARRLYSILARRDSGALAVYSDCRDVDVVLRVGDRELRVLGRITLQRWYLTPSKLGAKLRAVYRRKRRWSGETDTTFFILAPYTRGLTRGARELRRRHRVIVGDARTVGYYIAKYLLRRLTALAERLRGRRVWGRVLVAMATLYYTVLELDKAFKLGLSPPIALPPPEELLLLLERGITIEA